MTSLPGLGVASSGGDVRVDAGMLPFEIDPEEESVGLKQIKNFRVKRNQNEANSGSDGTQVPKNLFGLLQLG